VDTKQTSLTSFFSPTKPKPKSQTQPISKRSHRIKISDSKTRASGTLPRESDTTAGQLQVMLYKELFDAMISPDTSQVNGNIEKSSNVTMTFEGVFEHLGLSPTEPLSEAFIRQSRPIVVGNMLRYETGEARCLGDMVIVWRRYVEALGLGTPEAGKEGDGRSEVHLELVYRRAGGRKKGKGKGKDKSGRKRNRPGQMGDTQEVMVVDQSEDRELQLAIELSLQTNHSSSVNAEGASASTNTAPVLASIVEEAVSFIHPPGQKPMTEEEREKEEDALALEIELAYRQTGEIQDAGEVIPIRASQDSTPLSKDAMDLDVQTGMIEEGDDDDPKSGTIIGRHRFKYDSRLLKIHLENVMSYWRGFRQPSGVDIHNTRRCGWCEFEDGCEWR
jgi:exonuclease V